MSRPVGVGDAELSCVLILASRINDQLDTVSSGTVRWLELVGRGPAVATGIWDVLYDSVLRQCVCLRTFQKDKSDGALGGWVPCDLKSSVSIHLTCVHVHIALWRCERERLTAVGLSDRHNVIQARSPDRVPFGLSTFRLRVGIRQRHEACQAGREQAEEREVARGRHCVCRA
jgi:hypothetical protein